jgi:RAB protein geranylgeranyltransferase component A
MSDLVKQPALRRWQESVYGKGPYQVPDYESMAAIVQEHEQMADRIEELEAKLEAVTTVRELMGHMWGLAEDKLQKAIEALERIASGEFSGRMLTSMPPQDAAQYFARTALAELKGRQK